MSLHWKDLGPVTTPGYYRVRGVGVIDVIQEDIDRAAGLGGDAVLTLQDVFPRREKERTFDIRFMR